MTALETRVEGDPAALEAYADWVRRHVAAVADDAASDVADAATSGRAWSGAAGQAFLDRAGGLAGALHGLASRAAEAADLLAAHAQVLRAAQAAADAVRRRAAAAGLPVVGTLVHGPGAPALLPAGAEAAAYAARAAQQEAFAAAQAEVQRIRGMLAESLPLLADAVDVYRGLVGDQWAIAAAQASLDWLTGAAARDERLLRVGRLPGGSAEADRLAAAARSAKATGGPALFGLGVAWDLQQGESLGQAVASNGAGAAAGWGAGLAMAQAYAVAGSAGGPWGVAAGVVIGTGAAIMASGAVDRLWQDRDVRTAVGGGVEALGDTLVAAGDGLAHVGEEVVEGAEDIGDGVGAAWSWVEERVT